MNKYIEGDDSSSDEEDLCAMLDYYIIIIDTATDSGKRKETKIDYEMHIDDGGQEDHASGCK